MKKFIAYFSPFNSTGAKIPGVEFEAVGNASANAIATRYAKENVIVLNAVVDVEEFTNELFKAAA